MSSLPGTKAAGTFILRGDRVLIECESDAKTYGNGIIKPDKYQRYARTGWVRLIGDDVIEPDFIIDDKVLYHPYTGIDLDLNGKDYKIIRPADLLCVMNDKHIEEVEHAM